DSIAACLMRRFIPSFPTRRSSDLKATDQIYLHISNLKMQYLPQPALRHLHLDLLRLLELQRRRWKWILIYQPYHGLLGKDLDLLVVQIGRASCRERAWFSAVDGRGKRKETSARSRARC